MSIQKPHLQIIVGSVRQGRATAPLAHWAERRLRTRGEWSVELIDLADWSFPQLALARPPALGGYEDRLQRSWARTVQRGDAYLIAAPEYNHGYPGVLKTALDYVYAEWRGKPASCLAFGNAEGARMVEALQQVFVELGMIPVAPAAHIRDAHAKLVDGRFEADDRDEASLDKVSAELASACHRLRTASEVAGASSPATEAPRALVIGLGPETIQSVVEPLRRGGIDATGMVLPGSIDQLTDPAGLCLVSFGRGALGPAADQLKDELRRRNSKLLFVDTIVPLAVRQIEAALAERAGAETSIVDTQVTLAGGTMTVAVELRAPGRIGVTSFTLQTAIVAQRVATLELPKGRTQLDLPSPDPIADSVIVDADGAEFRHHAFRKQ
jgi:NAD(P)H-dependent FMN reductase